MNDFSQAIIKTLAFFDAQDIPLSLVQLRKNLLEYKEPASLGDIRNEIRTKLKTLVFETNGFYHLRGRKELANRRSKYYQISLSRYRLAKWYLRGLRFVPFVRAVAISGSQALLNSRDVSDIDLLIITKSNRIWLARLLVSLYFQLLGKRRYRNFTQCRFCLNHYLDSPDEIEIDRNMYTAVEYANLVPVMGEPYWQEFFANNQWVKDYLPNMEVAGRVSFFDFRSSVWQRLGELFLEFTLMAPLGNYLSGLYQRARIKKSQTVTVADSELSFHPDSKGQRVLVKFQSTLEKIRT